MKNLTNKESKKPYVKPKLVKVDKHSHFRTVISVNGELYMNAAVTALERSRPIAEVLSEWAALGAAMDHERSIELLR